MHHADAACSPATVLHKSSIKVNNVVCGLEKWFVSHRVNSKSGQMYTCQHRVPVRQLAHIHVA